MLKEKLKMMNGVLENGNYQLGQFKFIALFKNIIRLLSNHGRKLTDFFAFLDE